jgi:hypothetical protein
LSIGGVIHEIISFVSGLDPAIKAAIIGSLTTVVTGVVSLLFLFGVLVAKHGLRSTKAS